ncbi:MAG: Rieske 2Fe-2S domain-containing protein, partial [Polyangiaceae bacterium]
MSARFPFPSFPRGWFVVGFTHELAPGTVKTVHYFDEDIVLFRTAKGALSAVSAFCPHLGAHLGGGAVDGESLRCPFHAWGFDGAGRCVDIPYASKIPPNARVRAWPVLEHNGVIMVHYAPEGTDPEPSWRPAPLVEEGWTPNRTIRWELDSHPQEVGENTVDCAHLTPVHHVTKTEILEVEQKEHVMRVLLHLVATGHVIGMPDEINDVHLDVTLHGLGQIISSTHVITAGLRTRQRIHPTPISRDRIAIFAIANTLAMSDDEYTREIDEIFWTAFTNDFVRDFPIWGKKAYLERPLLAKGDGPIGSYRRWCRQFYVAPPSESRADAPTAAPERASVLSRILGDERVIAAKALLARVRPSAAARRATPPREESAEDLPRAGDASSSSPARPADAASKKRFSSVDDYFGSLAARFDPGAAGDLDAVFQWSLSGASPREHFAEVRG